MAAQKLLEIFGGGNIKIIDAREDLVKIFADDNQGVEIKNSVDNDHELVADSILNIFGENLVKLINEGEDKDARSTNESADDDVEVVLFMDGENESIKMVFYMDEDSGNSEDSLEKHMKLKNDAKKDEL